MGGLLITITENTQYPEPILRYLGPDRQIVSILVNEFVMKCSFQHWCSEHCIFLTSPRVKATWRPTGWKERKTCRSRPRQSCATAVSRKTLRTRVLMGEQTKGEQLGPKIHLSSLHRGGLGKPPRWLSRNWAHHPLQHQTASKTWKVVFGAFVCLKESCWPLKKKNGGSATLGLVKHNN